MPANKMPEMPEPEEFIWWMGINENHKARAAKRYYTHAEVKADRRACYLAGLEAARGCVGDAVTYTDLKGPDPRIPEHNAYNRGVIDGMNGRRATALASLEALMGVADKPADAPGRQR